jgi:hypothetical protein
LSKISLSFAHLFQKRHHFQNHFASQDSTFSLQNVEACTDHSAHASALGSEISSRISRAIFLGRVRMPHISALRAGLHRKQICTQPGDNVQQIVTFFTVARIKTRSHFGGEWVRSSVILANSNSPSACGTHDD